MEKTSNGEKKNIFCKNVQETANGEKIEWKRMARRSE